MKSKKELIERLKTKPFKILTKTHRFYNITRKAEKIQSNNIRFEGGSWLYFKDIQRIDHIFKSETTGLYSFLISDLCGGYIEYQEVKEVEE